MFAKGYITSFIDFQLYHVFHNFDHVPQYISTYSQNFGEILHTDFTEMAELQKILFAASYARCADSHCYNARRCSLLPVKVNPWPDR